MLQTKEWMTSPGNLRPAEGWHLKSASTNHGFSTCELKGLNCVTKKFPLNLHFYQQLNCVAGIRDVYKQVSFPLSFAHVKPELHFSVQKRAGTWVVLAIEEWMEAKYMTAEQKLQQQGMIYHAPIHDGNLSWEEALLVWWWNNNPGAKHLFQSTLWKPETNLNY